MILIALQVTVNAWQEFDLEREAIWQFICLVSPVLQRELIFSSLDNLKTEMKNVKVRAQTKIYISYMFNELWTENNTHICVCLFRSFMSRVSRLLYKLSPWWRRQQILNLVLTISLYYRIRPSPQKRDCRRYRPASGKCKTALIYCTYIYGPYFL